MQTHAVVLTAVSKLDKYYYPHIYNYTYQLAGVPGRKIKKNIIKKDPEM